MEFLGGWMVGFWGFLVLGGLRIRVRVRVRVNWGWGWGRG